MAEKHPGKIAQFLVNHGFISKIQFHVPVWRVEDGSGGFFNDVLDAQRSSSEMKSLNYSDKTPYNRVEFSKPELTKKAYRAIEIGLSAIAIAEILFLVG